MDRTSRRLKTSERTIAQRAKRGLNQAICAFGFLFHSVWPSFVLERSIKAKAGRNRNNKEYEL